MISCCIFFRGSNFIFYNKPHSESIPTTSCIRGEENKKVCSLLLRRLQAVVKRRGDVVRLVAAIKFKITFFFSLKFTFSQFKHLTSISVLLWIKYGFLRFTHFHCILTLFTLYTESQLLHSRGCTFDYLSLTHLIDLRFIKTYKDFFKHPHVRVADFRHQDTSWGLPSTHACKSQHVWDPAETKQSKNSITDNCTGRIYFSVCVLVLVHTFSFVLLPRPLIPRTVALMQTHSWRTVSTIKVMSMAVSKLWNKGRINKIQSMRAINDKNMLLCMF